LRIWRHASWTIKFSLIYLVLLFAASLIFPLLAKTAVSATDIHHILQGPSFAHWLGTDSLGRDLGLRILAGAQVTLWMGVLISLLTLVIGVAYGTAAALAGGWWDLLLMRVLEMLSSLPQLMTIGLLVFAFSRFENSQGVLSLCLAIGLGSWMLMARLVRNLAVREKSLLYTESAIAIGASPLRLVFRHWLPNLLPAIAVLVGLQLPNFLLFESFLSFLGLGLQPPASSWGILLQEGWRAMGLAPALLLFPSAFLFLTILALNLVFNHCRTHLLRPFQAIDLHQ
jgi:oligopeptide transport system permease protein